MGTSTNTFFIPVDVVPNHGIAFVVPRPATHFEGLHCTVGEGSEAKMIEEKIIEAKREAKMIEENMEDLLKELEEKLNSCLHRIFICL